MATSILAAGLVSPFGWALLGQVFVVAGPIRYPVRLRAVCN